MIRHSPFRSRTQPAHRALPVWLACCLLALLPVLPLPAQGLPAGMHIRGTGGQGGFPGGQMQNRRGQYGIPQGVGNQDRGFLTGPVWFSPESKDAKETPGAGTIVVVVTSKKDTLYTTAAESGRFRIFNVPTGQARVSFKMIGYGEEGHLMDITPGENKVVAYLKPESYQLEGAVLKADIPPIAIDKDTIIFRAAAVKVNKGEMAIDILSQMPGVEITETGARVLNEDVTRVYVDGALLFGEAPMSALNNLPAEEVVDIRSYQEYANKDPYHKISQDEEKERVLDVRTKSRPTFVLNGDTLAGGGFDTDSTFHKFRYTAGATVHATSEKLQVHFNVNANNINNDSNRRRGNFFSSAGGGGGNSPDLRNLSLSASVNKNWMSPTTRNFVLGSIGGSYSYSDNYNVSESISQLVYFPNEKYESRVEDQSSRSDATSKAHNFSVNGSKALKDGRINLTGSFKLTENQNHSWSSHYNQQDARPRQGTATGTESGSDGRSFNTSFHFNKRFRSKWGISLQASGSGSHNESASLKTDTTTSTISYKEIDISGLGSSRNWSVQPQLSWNIDDRQTLMAFMGWSSNFSRTERFAYDISDPLDRQMDTVNTYTHTTANNNRTARLGYRIYFPQAKTHLNAHLTYHSIGINKNETFPYPDLYDHRFRRVDALLNVGNQTMINHWNLDYSSGGSTPSVEQIRPRIDNSNLYNVTAGNPDLQQSRNHQLNLNYSTVLGARMRQTIRDMEAGTSLEEALAAQQERSAAPPGTDPPIRTGGSREGAPGGPRGGGGMGQAFSSVSTFSTNGSFTVTRNPIVARRIYYAEDTYLPRYDYTMPAQSTFRTWENAPNSYSASYSARFDIYLEKIRWFWITTLSMNWDSRPSYVDEVLTRTRNLHPTLGIRFRSNFSRNIRLNLSATGAYVYSTNDLQDKTSYFTERLNAGWEINNIFQHAYVGGNYRKSFTQGVPYAKIDDNVFDLRGGVRFGPRNNIEFSAAVHDLFNKTQGFTTSMSSNYITNKWVHQFGRYVMFSLSYRFNSMRKGAGSKPAAPRGGR